MKTYPTASTQFAALDDQHRRIDGPLPRTGCLTGGWQSVMRRDVERRIAGCRRAIARRREAVASRNPFVDPMLSRLTNRLVRLRAAQIDQHEVDARS